MARYQVCLIVDAPDDADPDTVAGYIFNLVASDPGGDEYVTTVEDYAYQAVS